MRITRLLMVLGLWVYIPLLPGQAVSTQILGLVTDPSGAVIPGATIQITRQATSEVRTATTNETGNYIFPLLDIGEYEIRCSAEGFRSQFRSNLALHLQDKLRIDFQMEIGEQVEMIEVTAAPPLLHTDDATLGTVVDRRRVVDLPLNGRNFAQLATLIPGVTFGLSRMGLNGQGTIGTRALPGQMVGLSANGQRDINQNITLDGATATEVHKSAMMFAPPLEAVQEFKIQSAVYSAEFGGNSGLQADVAIRSGSNELHGSVFEFLRNDKMDARGYFLPPAFEKNHLRRNQFGGMVSGPVVRDRTFWLFSYEGRRERRGTPASMGVPTTAMRAGDFSELLEPQNRWRGRTTPITAPGSATPLPNNIIPESMIDPVARNLLTYSQTSPFGGGFIPPANFDAEARLFGTSINRVGTNDQEIDANSFLGRVDHVINDNNRLFAHYLLVDSDWLSTPLDLVSRIDSDFQGHSVGFGYSKILSPTAVNEFRFGWLRHYARTTGDQTDAGFSQADLGLDLSVVRDGNRPLTPFEEGLPQINMQGFRSIQSGKIEKTVSSVYELGDTLSVNRGKHNLKFGGLYQWNTVDLGAANNPRGQLNFDNDFAGIGYSFAGLMLGYPQSGLSAEGFPLGALRQQRAGVFFLDDFKATSRLTINFGIRWDFFGTVEDANGRIRTLSFAPEHVQTINGRQVPMLIPDPDTRASLYEIPWTQVMPRLGLAYRLSPSWVLRAGAGQYYAPLQTNTLSILALNPPYSGGITYFSNPMAPVTTSNMLQAFPFLAPQSLVMLGNLDAENGNRSHVKGNDVWQWTLELEKSLGDDFVVGMAYLGSATSNLDISIPNFNNPDPGLGDPQARRPYTAYVDSANPEETVPLGLVRRVESSVSSHYNALQLRAEKRYSGGLTFNASFNYQKAMGIGYSTNEEGGFGPAIPQDPRNLRAEYGRSNFDQRFRFVFSHVWDLPWMRDAKGVTGALLGGWSLNGIVGLTSGLPVTVIQAGNPHGTGPNSLARPHIVHGESVDRVMDGRSIARWFNTDAFVGSKCDGCSGSSLVYMGPKGYGNAGVSLFDAPAQKTWDVGVSKNFQVGEGRSLQFRWEAFNFLNTPQFNAPNNLLGTPTFGQITSTVLDNREMQFGLKYMF